MFTLGFLGKITEIDHNKGLLLHCASDALLLTKTDWATF
jgi:hypothetical protein